MSSGDRQLRLVVQSVSANASAPVYRLIVYPEQKNFRGPLTFATREGLLRHLSAAIPGFDARQLREPNGSARILFAATVELSDAQIARLFEF
jgi:hypothetical protein